MATRIYTRTGDTGNTDLFGGVRVAKDDIRVEAYGAVDELNASIGAVRALGVPNKIDSVLERVQHDLFQLGADLSTPEQAETGSGPAVATRIVRVNSDRADMLEAAIDRFEAELEPLKRFILPGGHPTGALLHVSRTICRRAERRCVSLDHHLAHHEATALNPAVILYLNRLSDLLFVLARAANQAAGIGDVLWDPEV